jgi:hypothetical protein
VLAEWRAGEAHCADLGMTGILIAILQLSALLRIWLKVQYSQGNDQNATPPPLTLPLSIAHGPHNSSALWTADDTSAGGLSHTQQQQQQLQNCWQLDYICVAMDAQNADGYNPSKAVFLVLSVYR